jgi:hypothetical protein
MRRSIMTCARQFLAAGALLGVASVRIAHADTTVPILGIGTSVKGAFVINTHADSVTYSDPVDVVINGMAAVEIRGTVSGVGWGGTGIVARAANAHYNYNIPFVARWRKHEPGQRLVFYNHGGGPSVIAAVKRNKQSGAANASRFAELNGDLTAGVPALLDHAAYISINRRGLGGDGTFSATYMPPIPPLTAAEVSAIQADLATSPGDPTFLQPGIVAGAPVPVLPTNDAPTCRDISRALEQVVAGILGKPFHTRIGVGTSSGAILFAALDFGRSVIGTQSVRTGGNNVVPYDVSSPRLFDGFIFNGFPYAAGVAQADVDFPLSAPAMFFQGQGDERYQQHVTMAHELLQRGVVLDGSVWLYEVKNLTHITRDNVFETTQPSNGDRLGCFMGAAIHNLRAFLEQGKPPPRSRMAGRIVGGALRFHQAGGSTTNVAPVPNDPTLDSYVVDANLTPRPIGSPETTRWLAVTAALPHVGDAITPPTVACRLGGYRLMFFGSQLVPFSPAVLAAKYGCFWRYRECVCQTVCCLEAQGLYDPRVESACESAELARALFEPTCRSRSAGCTPWRGKTRSRFIVGCAPRSW